MNILFISSELIGSAVIHKLIHEGHNVKLFIMHPDRKDCFEGFVEKVENWKEQLSWVGKDGLIVFDDVVFQGEQDALRNKGYSVFGGNELSDKLELDRQYFHKILENYGINILPSYDFKTAEEAIAHVENSNDVWVVKQSAHMGVLNYVGQREDNKDVLDVLHMYKERNVSPIHLQKRVYGIEIGVGRYFNGNDWVGPIEVNLEHKPLCNDNLGPLTAEMGTVMWLTDNEQFKLYQETLTKLKTYLQEIRYKGDFEINCIVTEKEIWPLEATMRFGTPALELQCELITSNWGDFLKAVADGNDYDLKYKKGYGVVVSAMVPPFPYAPEVFEDSKIVTNQGAGIFFMDSITEEERGSIHFEEASVRIDPDGNEHLYLAGKHGYAGYVTGCGKTVQDAQKKVYSTIKKLIIPKMFYRTDIGNKFVQEEHKKLIDWGWINS